MTHQGVSKLKNCLLVEDGLRDQGFSLSACGWMACWYYQLHCCQQWSRGQNACGCKHHHHQFAQCHRTAERTSLIGKNSRLHKVKRVLLKLAQRRQELQAIKLHKVTCGSRHIKAEMEKVRALWGQTVSLENLLKVEVSIPSFHYSVLSAAKVKEISIFMETFGFILHSWKLGGI